MKGDRPLTLQDCIDGAVADLEHYLESPDESPWGNDRKAMVHEIATNAKPVDIALLQAAAFDAIEAALWRRLGVQE